MNSTMNFYQLLGISKNASKEEIKIAYKTQMKKWHPDINKSIDAVNMSSKINEAKEVLLDDEKRRDYDLYLNKKIEESYNRYTKKKQANNNTDNYSKEANDNIMVTKWQYLKDWLKFAKETQFRKFFGLLGVLIESALCLIIKACLIILAFLCNLGSVMIRTLFSYLSPVLGLLGLLFVGQSLSIGFKETITQNKGLFNGIIVCNLLFILSVLMPVLSDLILSPKVFDILYNKIDIKLFKVCVGYKEV